MNIDQQAIAQAIYMQYLLEEAHKLANTTNLFDPQGRVLVEVRLTDEQKDDVLGRINKQLGTKLTTNQLGTAIGIKPTSTTTVSLDIAKIPELRAKFSEQLKQAFKARAIKEEKLDTLLKAVAKQPKGSIIALQQEFHFHLSLAARVYQKIAGQKLAGQLKEQEMKAAHAAAVEKVNSHIMAVYAKALENSLDKKGNLNIEKLNKALDKARKDLTPIAHTILMHEIVAKTGVILTKAELKKSTLKRIAEETTATPNDILHTDNELGLITLIEGSESTAHHRKAGNEFAHRQLITHVLNENGVIPNPHPRVQIRTPSPVVKEGLTEQGYIDDVTDKLATITTDYALSETLVGNAVDGKPKAFIYNRYTAINDTLGDINGNLQTQSANHILQGAHQYNAKQLQSGDPVFCFVQGISVNGFGDHLGYESSNALTKESTLMAEMAFLHTLYDTSTPEQQKIIREVFTQYKQFLTTPSRKPYFSQSVEGQQAIEAIKGLKTNWANELLKPVSDDLFESVQNSLKNLIANDLHFDHDYAKLIQSLSVTIEEASIGGCKSGNERAQAINGRVEIMDAVMNTPVEKLTSEGRAIKDALIQLAQGNGNDIIKAANELKSAVDNVYNKMGLQTAASIVSLIDQGASAKVEAKPDHPFYISRNYAEESASTLPNLQQSNAGKMQAHKGLPSQMALAWEGHPVSWWSRMKSNPLGVIGAIIGTIIFPIAVAVGIYSAVDNSRKKTETSTINTKLEKAYQPISEPIRGSDVLMMEKGVASATHPDKQDSESQLKDNFVTPVASEESVTSEKLTKEAIHTLKTKDVDLAMSVTTGLSQSN